MSGKPLLTKKLGKMTAGWLIDLADTTNDSHLARRSARSLTSFKAYSAGCSGTRPTVSAFNPSGLSGALRL
jgi:hypothetical protein